MRLALVHDYLNQFGGGERVLGALAELFPEAPIFTLFYDRQKLSDYFGNRVKTTSFLDSYLVQKSHRPLIPLMPLAASSLNLKDDYDVVISSTAGFAKGVSCSPKTLHIAYCHTPLRYAWEYDRYFDWHPFLKFLTAPLFYYLRSWDKRTSKRPNLFLANSNFIKEKIQRYYEREAEVVYPPVDLRVFYRDPKIRRDNYFLAAGRLMRYKRFDLVIQAFNRLNLTLLIVGDGPELENLKKIVRSPKIHFLPFAKENELRALYNGAEALIFPQVEDFGLVAAEAQACGTPVIAFGEGGAKEIVADGKTGILFHQQTPEALAFAVKKFLLSSFSERIIRESAKRFSKVKFKDQILKILDTA